MGFEPTTFSLARRRSTTEPRPQSAETQDRTEDTAIFSRVLYQLSYLGQHPQRARRVFLARVRILAEAGNIVKEFSQSR